MAAARLRGLVIWVMGQVFSGSRVTRSDPGHDPCDVMGHMGHGSSIQWVTWVMGHLK